MNEQTPLQRILTSLNNRRPVLLPALAFLAGCLVTGLFLHGQRSLIAGRLNQRYHRQHRGATEIIGRLETELAGERELNRELRDHNLRARTLTKGLTDTAERNVRNLQDAVTLIAEIRTKLKILADFYSDSDTGDGSD